MDPRQARELIVNPLLQELGLWSQAAEDLLIGTAAQESHFKYIHQLGKGPALGFWQMEPATHEDIWRHYLGIRPIIAKKIRLACDLADVDQPDPEVMVYNIRYACAMCRVHYLRSSEPIPDTLEGQAAYWKTHYNTMHGAGTPEQYIANYPT